MTGIFLKVNGFDFSPHFVINAITRPAYSVINEMVNIKSVTGQKNVSTKFDSFLITLDITIAPDLSNSEFGVTDIENLIKEKMLSKTDQQYIFSDRPDRYYLGKLEGESSVVWITETLATMTLSIRVADGLAHALEPRSFPFITTNGDTLATVQNNGTYQTPIDIDVTFTSDANSIGFVSSENIVQLGTSYSEDSENSIASDKIMNDDMGTATKNLWSVNVGRPRWRYDDGDNTSKVEGTLTWGTTDVTPASYGSFDTSKPGYWHGPTITRMLTDPLTDFEVLHRLEFKPRGTKAQIPLCQGLIEINYSDADNNFILGFEMKDNTTTSDQVTYSFFVGDYRIYEANLPKSVLTYNGGFFGSLLMGKVGNKFYFRLARIDGDTWKETWSTPTKSWTNNTVAMLSASIINAFMAQWRNYRTMSIKLTHTRITQFNTDTESLIPKTFYEGDNLFVDGATNRVYINGIRDDSYRVTGSSQFLTAQKGTNEVVAISDGSFEGKLTIRERYL